MGKERSRLRTQLTDFITDATDSVPVNFVDLHSGSTRVGCYTLDRSLKALTLEVGADRCTIPLEQIAGVFPPEACVSWERAGHAWPMARLRRLVLANVRRVAAGEKPALHSGEECCEKRVVVEEVLAWLEADEPRRDRCILSLAILTSQVPRSAGSPNSSGQEASAIQTPTTVTEASAPAASVSGLGTTK